VKFWIALFLVAVFSNLPATPARAVDLPAGMVLVPAGEFIMGTNEVQEGGHTPGDSTPQHTRTLPAFYIDRTEVTNAQYKAYCDATGYPPPASWNTGAYLPEQAQHPVTHVNWYEAQAYALWAGQTPANRGRVGKSRARNRWPSLSVGQRVGRCARGVYDQWTDGGGIETGRRLDLWCT
jgi:formylglycine-generating enzyme required for sulfatase activity